MSSLYRRRPGPFMTFEMQIQHVAWRQEREGKDDLPKPGSSLHQITDGPGFQRTSPKPRRNV